MSDMDSDDEAQFDDDDEVYRGGCGAVEDPTFSPARRSLNFNDSNGRPRSMAADEEGLLSKVCEADFTQYVSGFDIICLTETFLERIQPLDCFPDFLQFSSPALKLSHHGRSSGGVLLLVKRVWEKFVSVPDLSQDMVWLKIDRTVFSCEKHVVLCGAYVCPSDSPYYRQAHVAVTSSIYSVEQCLLIFIQRFDRSCCYL